MHAEGPEGRAGHEAHEGGHGREGNNHGHGGGHAGHDHAHHAAVFRRRFWINLVLALPVIGYSHMVQSWVGYTAPAFPGAALVPPVLGTVVFVYGGWVFLAGAVDEARQRRPGMMLLIGLAITVAFVASVATEAGLVGLDFWWEMAALVVVMLLGHWQEMRAVGQARRALTALAELLPDEAERVTADGTETVPAGRLAEGDVVLVRPGGRVPADGRIVAGAAELDESMLTGESAPVPRGEGDRIVAGTVAVDSSIRVAVEATGDQTTLAGIQRLIVEAEQSGSRSQALADRAAAVLFYVAVGVAAVTFVTWAGLLARPGDAITRSVTVLVISCPHALGLAIPLVTALSTSLSARQGILVRDRLALERMRDIDTVLFDKTGTLTRGEHRVTGMAAVDDEAHVLALAAAAEAESEHPFARAIVEAAPGNGPKAERVESLPGRGVRARIEGAEVAVGGPGLLAELGLAVPPSLTEPVDEWRSRGAAVTHVVSNGEVIGVLALEDQVRPESREAVAALRERGMTVTMITGDASQVADAVAAELGIDEVFAEVRPEQKDDTVAQLVASGRRVAMVGDGVNDAPALARADVGIAIGAGTDVAIESADLVLAGNDPRHVVAAVRLSEASYAKMTQNLAWAAGYNVVAIPLAAGVLAPVGFVLPPAVGALLMSASTVVVALNAQLLRRLDLRPESWPSVRPD